MLRCVSFVRLFVDVKNGEPIPRKSILKSRSRENSVCSDTSESSAADFDERRMVGRSFSHDEATHSDTSDGITEEDSPTAVPLHPSSRFEVIKKTENRKRHLRLVSFFWSFISITARKKTVICLYYETAYENYTFEPQIPLMRT